MGSRRVPPTAYLGLIPPYAVSCRAPKGSKRSRGTREEKVTKIKLSISTSYPSTPMQEEQYFLSSQRRFLDLYVRTILLQYTFYHPTVGVQRLYRLIEKWTHGAHTLLELEQTETHFQSKLTNKKGVLLSLFRNTRHEQLKYW